MSDAQSLGRIFRDTCTRLPNKKAFFFKQSGRYVSITWQEAENQVNALCAQLLERGFKAGEKIAILSENRFEWALMDLAALSIGAVTVPIYTSFTPNEIEYLLQDSETVLLAVSNRTLFEKITPIQKKLPALRAVIAFDSALSVHQNELGVPLLIMKGLIQKKPAAAFSLPSIEGESVASIIYTSGTTGLPKGVLLTHKNFIANLLLCKKALKMGETDAHLYFLPLSHVFERTAGYYLMVHIGASIAYAESMDTLSLNMLETKPTFILGVPRFYEKFRERVAEKLLKASAFKKALFAWAKELGRLKRISKLENKPFGLAQRLEYALADRLVYSKFKKTFGGRLRFGISGGAPLSKEVAEFFYDMGILICEGYGLTETAPVITATREDKFRFGTVGLPLDTVLVKIAEDGEILTKSDCVMQGYFKKPQETEEVLKAGWFYTGDLGFIDKQGFLTITGRKKELIVTSGGKKVAPRPIEELLEQNPYILRCVLYGEGRKFITALIVPRKEPLLEHARTQKIAYTTYSALLKNTAIYQFFEGHIADSTKDLASFEKIKYFSLLENDFTQNAGELTPTLKVKRAVVLTRYRQELEPFYEKAANV